MGSLVTLMSPTELTASKMILAHSPINEMAQKARWFDRIYPRPQAPTDAEGNPLPDAPWMITGSDIPIVTDPSRPISVAEAIGDLPKLQGHQR